MPAAVLPVRLEMGPVTDLANYARIPNRFCASSVMDVFGTDPHLALRERKLKTEFSKDYDAIESPLQWPSRFNVENWVRVDAFIDSHAVGGAIAAFDSPGIDLLEGRSDLVVLWDIRVSPDKQGRGIGTELFRAVQDWGRARGARELKVETQNVNVAACHFYRAMGCELVSANPGAYPNLPDEVKLLWSTLHRP